MLGIDGKVLKRPSKKQLLTVVPQNCKNLAAKHSIEEPMLLNFLNLSTIFFNSDGGWWRKSAVLPYGFT